MLPAHTKKPRQGPNNSAKEGKTCCRTGVWQFTAKAEERQRAESLTHAQREATWSQSRMEHIVGPQHTRMQPRTQMQLGVTQQPRQHMATATVCTAHCRTSREARHALTSLLVGHRHHHTCFCQAYQTYHRSAICICTKLGKINCRAIRMRARASTLRNPLLPQLAPIRAAVTQPRAEIS